MAVKMHQAVMGKKVGDSYEGPQEEWLVANGYASVLSDSADERSAADIEKTPGSGRPTLDVAMDQHPMNAENRKDDGGNPTRTTARNASLPTVEVEGAQGDAPTPADVHAVTRPVYDADADASGPTRGAVAEPTGVSGATQDVTPAAEPTPGSGTGQEREKAAEAPEA